jgi:hypothetical protein
VVRASALAIRVLALNPGHGHEPGLQDQYPALIRAGAGGNQPLSLSLPPPSFPLFVPPSHPLKKQWKKYSPVRINKTKQKFRFFSK